MLLLFNTFITQIDLFVKCAAFLTAVTSGLARKLLQSLIIQNILLGFQWVATFLNECDSANDQIWETNESFCIDSVKSLSSLPVITKLAFILIF